MVPSLVAVAPEWLKGAIMATLVAIATISAITMIIGTIQMYLQGKEKVWGYSRNRFFSRRLHRFEVVFSIFSSFIGISGGTFGLMKKTFSDI